MDLLTRACIELVCTSFLHTEVTQDIASKGLGLVYDSCDEVQRKDLISNLVGTLMTGKR